MKKILAFLLTLMMGLSSLSLSAQYTLTVADGTETNGYVPIYGFYVDDYVRSQTIYPASMLTDMNGLAITALTFYFSSTPSSAWGVTFEVRLKEVADSAFASAAFLTTDATDVVYTGLMGNSSGVISVDLTNAYTYNGGNLLLEVVSVNTGTYSSASFYGISADNASVQGYNASDVSSITPSFHNFIPKTTFEYGVVMLCSKPSNLAASNIAESSATITWNGSDEANAYVLQYMPASSTDWDNDATELTTTDTYIDLSNLIPATTYQVRVKVLCSDNNETAWSTILTFTPGTYIMASTGSDTLTTCGLMIYDDGGPNGSYSNNSNSTLVLIPANDGEMMMVSGTASLETNYDKLYIYDGIGTDNLLATITGSNQTVSVISTTGPLTIRYTSDVSSTYAGFELLAQCVSCFPPSNITVSNQTADGATLSWTGEASEYALYLSGAMSGYYTTTGDSYTFTGLNGSSHYTVQIRALCGGDSSILSSSVAFNTACDAITVTDATPWTEDFEDYTGTGAQPFVCWETPVTYTADNGVAPFVYCGYGEACHSGQNSAEMKGTMNMLVLPEFTNDIHDLRLSFWATSYGSNTNVEVGVITDIYDTATFEPLCNAGTPGPRGGSNGGNGNYMGAFDFNSVQATSGRIALRFTGPGASSGWNVDDFTVSLSPSCTSPVKTSVMASNVGGHSANITFIDNDPTHNSWTVFYRESDASDDDIWLNITTSLTSAYLTNLDPETDYDVYVITNCGTPEANPDATLTITFTTDIACPAPNNLTLSAVSSEEATVSWTGVGTAFNVEYGPLGFTPGTGTSDVATTTSYTMSNLTPNTAYTIYVTNDCTGNNDGTSTTASFNFTTSQIPVDLPYFADFSDPSDDWALNNGSCSNFWTIGSANNVDALFITNDSITPGYNVSNYSVVSAEKLVTVGDNTSFNITFDVQVGGESTWDYLKVFFAPATVSYPASTSSTTYSDYSYSTNAVDFSSYLSLTGQSSAPYKINLTQNNTLQVAVEMPNPNAEPDANSTAKLVFLWQNDSSQGTQPGAVISNVTVTVNGCPSPSDLADSNIATSSADIYWTPGDEESEWEVEYGVSGFNHGAGMVESVYGNPTITLTNLNVATHYDVYVRAICGGSDSSLWVGPLTFVTACDIITTLPYTENFDNLTANSSTRPDCWSYPITYSNAPYVTSGYSSSAPNSLFFQSLTTSPTTAVTPQFDADINTLRVKFMLKMESTSYSGTFEVGVMSDPNDVNTFESVRIIQPANTSWNQYMVSFDSTSMTGGGKYIAFRQNSNSSSWYYWLDDVMVMLIPTCEEPTDIVSTGSTATSVTLAWTANGDESTWNIEYGPTGFTQGDGTEVVATSNPFEVENLTSGTTYDFYVQADCGGGDNSIWVGPYTATPGSYSMPTTGTNSITGCEMVIYDDGGINGSYSPYCESYLTINPETTDNAVSVQGTLSTESCCDYLRIYDGPDINGTLLGEFKGENQIIPELSSTTGPITLHFHSDVSIQNTGFVLNVSCVSNTCPKPTNVHATDATTTSVTLDWTPFGSETSWEIAYGEGSFDPEDATANVVTANAHPFEIQNLNSSTAYTFYVRAFCSSDDQSSWTSPIIASTACDIISLPYAEDFDSYIGSTYTDNQGIAPACWSTFSTNATYGNPHIVSSGSYHYAESGNSMVFTCGSAGADAYAALPTFDQPLNTLKVNFWRAMENTSNGTLTVGYVTNLADLANTFVEVATIPSVSSTSGDTISVDFTSINIASGNICFHWNYASSYYSCCIDNVNVISDGSGPVITDPTVTTNAATAVGQTNATLNATITNPSNVNITAKGFEWKTTTGGTFTQIVGTGTGNSFTANLTGLTPNTGYTFKAFITYNGQTAYGTEQTFTTLDQGVDPCDVPTGITTSNITKESITVSWNANPDVTTWNIQYRPQNGTLSSATSTTNSYVINGLNPVTTYEIQVQAVCSNGQTSDWSSIVTATTLPDGIVSHLENSVSLYPNPANEVVNVQCTMNNVQVETVDVVDVYGKVINTINVIDTPIRINVSGLAAGMYFVRVTTDQGVVTKPFVKK